MERERISLHNEVKRERFSLQSGGTGAFLRAWQDVRKRIKEGNRAITGTCPSETSSPLKFLLLSAIFCVCKEILLLVESILRTHFLLS